MFNAFSDDLYLNEKRFNCKKTLDEFHVKTEDALKNMLVKESKTIPCIRCGKEFPIKDLTFVDGDPYCKNCSQ